MILNDAANDFNTSRAVNTEFGARESKFSFLIVILNDAGNRRMSLARS